MRCYCCNKALSDYESTRRSASTGQFLDMCQRCFGSVESDILAIDRPDLRHEDEEEEGSLVENHWDSYFENKPYE